MTKNVDILKNHQSMIGITWGNFLLHTSILLFISALLMYLVCHEGNSIDTLQIVGMVKRFQNLWGTVFIVPVWK